VALGRDTTLMKEILDKAAEHIGKDLRGEPEVEAELRSTIGNVYEQLGLYEKAAAMHRAAVAIRRSLPIHRKLQGDGVHPDYGVALNNLAKNFVDQGNLPEAEDLFRQALETAKKTLPPKHPNVALALNNLAYTLSLTNDPARLTEAADLFQQALDMQREVLGEDNQAVALSLNNLSSVLNDLGRLSEAEARQREALGKWRKMYGDEHPVVPKSLRALADAMIRGHKYDEALNLCNELLPPDLENRRTGLLMVRAGVLARRARWKEAAADAAKAAAAKPDNDAQYGHILTLLRLADGDREEARQTCQQTLARFTATNDANAAVRMASDCLVIPLAGVDIEAAAGLADSAMTKNSTNVFHQFCKKLAEYRQGRFASAVTYMANPLESHGHSWDDRLHLQAHVVLAMAHWQLKQSDQARAALAEALKLAETTFPKAETGDLGTGWQDEIISQTLLAKAKVLITESR